MIINQTIAPLDVLQEEYTTRRIFSQLGEELFMQIPFDTPVVIKLTNEYVQDRDTPYSIRRVGCDITAVENEYVTIPHHTTIPMVGEYKKSRLIRLKQFIKGE